ncbi:hypothetical protein [Burkholderia sp. Ax-1719]|uniref:NACHT domain-containing protein n=1 Tax=Burkholderia sp. Ax-1719 TaxID=2608334 RepID=UPI001423D9D9|nr:hypothetical protein [Burkholderia sp. Ax-1719]NIE66846.1 hypothetical protein [Burkholderia sp. Ax-1719]
MTDKQSSAAIPKAAKAAKAAKNPKITSDKKTGGGTAVGGGVNFQAATTAIVGIHILRGTALGWLDGVCIDKPTAVWAESEGPGDDLRVELADGSAIEVQAKKGLARGASLWTALQSIAVAIDKGQLSHGVLAVAADSSNTVREELAKDIRRLGQGRTDQLSDIGAEWSQRLSQASIAAQTVCRCMRIKVIHALSEEDTGIRAAKEILRHVCARDEDADAAWNCLYLHAVHLIADRGRWTLPDLVRLLSSSNIAIRANDFPASVFDRYSRWMIETNSHFSVTGIKRKIPLVHLLPMRLGPRRFEDPALGDAALALDRYHKGTERKAIGEEFDSVWTARFKMLAVVVAGPGLGKSTMIKELAHQYARDGYLVLSVALKPIAAAMQQGAAFSEVLVKHALGGSSLTPDQIRSVPRQNWVVLADGLDECGSAHHDVAEQINKFALGHPGVRVVVTTRPIGYETAELSSWTHYNLLPPRKEEGAKNLEALVRAVLIVDSPDSNSVDLSPFQIGKISPSEAISVSPQLLGMSASLIRQRSTLPGTRLGLYTQLISLFEKRPIDKSAEKADLYKVVLDIIGWILVCDPLIVFDTLIDRAAEMLAPLMKAAPLALKEDIRRAVTHWERVGLIEKVYHDGTGLLTFIHKTFCEFVASRFLVRESSSLLNDVVDHPDRQEVLGFAVGQGLADDLIELYLVRHTAGLPQQLRRALGLLGNSEIVVSELMAQELVRQSFKAVEDGASDKFSIGVALSDIGAKANSLVEPLAAARLDATNPATKLVAWATAIRCGAIHYDATTLSAVLAELLTIIEPFNVRNIFDKKDRSDRDLLEIVALAALKAQPDDLIRSFAENELMDKKLRTLGFSFQVNEILKSRGIEELQSLLPDDKEVVSPVTLVPVGPSMEDAWLCAYQSIANAFANGYSETTIEKNPRHAFVQFAGLIHASGFMQKPVSDIYSWSTIHDEPALQATIKAVAQLLPLDLHSLAQEAKELVHRIDAKSFKSVFTFLPAVDIDPPAWEKAANVPLSRKDVIRGLLHPSVWINDLAANIFEGIQMTREELEALLRVANGDSLRYVIFLVERHHIDGMPQMLLRRLSDDASGDVSGIFDALRRLEIPPSAELTSTTHTCLCSADSNTAESATKLLSHWLDQGVAIDQESVGKAIEHWGGRDSWKHNPFLKTPIHLLNELFNRIRAAQ